MTIKNEAFLEHLIMQGALEMAGIDENGQMLYNITDKLKHVSPELYTQLEDQFKHHMFQLIDKGPKTMTWRFRG